MRALRRLAGALAAAALGCAAILAAGGAAPAQTTSTSTTTTTTPSGSSSGGGGGGATLSGEGSSAPFKEITTWQNDLSGAQSPINLNYQANNGSTEGRDDLINGSVDFAISGTQFGCSPTAGVACFSDQGFSPGEEGLLAHQNPDQDIIAAPVQVTALSFILSVPFPSVFQRADLFCTNDPDLDPNCPQPPAFITPMTNQPRVPNQNLAAMMMGANIRDTNALDNCSLTAEWCSFQDSWDAFSVLNAFGIQPPSCNTSPTSHCFANFLTETHPVPVLQSQSDELNFYLQQYVKTAAPTIWSAVKAANPKDTFQDAVGDPLERIPVQPGLSRQGADQAGDQMTIPGGVAGGSVAGTVAGAIGELPPSSLVSAPLGQPQPWPIEFIQVQNAAGEWVSPSPATIDAAVNAGGATPLYGLTHSVHNAYPLTWVSYLYVKAKGLTAAKTEAVATLIRYLATDGQGAAAPWGEGVLSSALVTQALNQANQVVRSDCPAAGGTIVSNNSPGSDAPSTPKLQTIGTMLHCVPPAPTSVGAASSGSNFPLTGVPSVPSTPAVAPAAPASTPAKSRTPLPASLTVGKLPLPLPGTPLDRIATLVLGGLAYLLLRDPLRRLFGRALE